MSLEKNTLNCHTAVQCKTRKYDRDLAEAVLITLYNCIFNQQISYLFSGPIWPKVQYSSLVSPAQITS